MAAAKPSSTKYQARAVGQRHAADRWRIDDDAGREAALGLVLAAEIDDEEMQRQRATRRDKGRAGAAIGRPKITPSSAPTSAAAGSVTQNGAWSSLNRMPAVKAPAASRPAWPSEIWPA